MKSRRILSLAAAAVAGIAASVVMASPARAATHVITIAPPEISCTAEGQWVIRWSVANSDPDLSAELTLADPNPADHPVSDIVVGATVPAGGSLEGIQTVPGTINTFGLHVRAHWVGPDNQNYVDEDSITRTENLAFCEPIYTAVETCDSVTFNFTPPEVKEVFMRPESRPVAAAPLSVDVVLTPSTGDPKTVTLIPGENQSVTLPATTGMTVTISSDYLETSVYHFTHEACPTPAASPLPLTGASTTGPIVIGASLLVVGVALVGGLFLFRRRRTVAGS